MSVIIIQAWNNSTVNSSPEKLMSIVTVLGLKPYFI